ncbi:hypothetical protein K66PH128C1_LOCUS36 [Klebsiella phage vB_Ko_K66PH128C1]|uniref:Uncharacterized protein n=1 Tax=Klebsiella phage vB_Ko_K66PH128C1 TaxID=3071610 RepID=A0AAD2GSE7_9CAUD|nr:hypothetical protein K66PH128C1_LOCUS36 [Klebsiella phage vB_Ko_K66PH128C1]
MSHKAAVVYAVDVDAFSKLVEGEISLHDIVLDYTGKGQRQFHPTGRTYNTTDFGGFTFIECTETK